MILFDTIAAVATPRGKGGIAVVRISGERAAEIADKVFTARSQTPLAATEARRMVYGDIYRQYGGERVCIDEGMAVIFRAPYSFTGENVVEISCHGGALVTESVLSAVIEAGARMATAGEFTRRAFVNGKMKLTQAEALGYLLEAKNENQMLLSRGGMRGILSGKTDNLYGRLVNVMGSVYAKIDFPDEDLNELSRDEMQKELSLIKEEVSGLAATYKTGRAVAEGIPTVICGHTNVGKSSIYNRIVGSDAAIVTSVEGTTRDILRETVSFGGVTLRLCDTAGLRKTDDLVENIGIQRARDEISSSELVFAVLDINSKMSDDDEELYRELIASGKTVIALYNKSDIVKCDMSATSPIFDKKLFVSAATGEGFPALEALVSSLFLDGSISLYNDAVVMDARQYSALVSTNISLERAIAAIEAGLSLDLCSLDIEEAMSCLGELDGREIGEDIVANIFSRFCVGK